MNKTVIAIVELRNLLIKSGDDPEEFFPSCRGCGYCCHEATCSLGVSLFGSAYPCPALFWNGEMYQCKVLSSWHSEDFADRLYIGSGCCSPLNSWRKEVKERWLNAISFKGADPDEHIKPGGV